MVLIFWQNIVSPHQIPYIGKLRELDSNLTIFLVVEKRLSKQRKRMGWTEGISKYEKNVELIIDPDESQISDLFKRYNKSENFFSGLRLSQMVNIAFKMSLNHNVKRHLIVEGPFYFNRLKSLHTLKTRLFEQKYFKYIDKVFCIGQDAREWYSKWGFNSQRTIPFAYCVDWSCASAEIQDRHSSPLRLLFVGSLIKRKGLDNFFTQLNKIDEHIHLDIIGNGPELSKLENKKKKLKKTIRINFLGQMPNTKISELMPRYDLLVLPSLHDGWGTVINEALMCGLFVLCSDKCGAKDLIHHNFNGIVFSIDKKNELVEAIMYSIKNLNKIRSNRVKIKEWSKSIGPNAVANYFMSALQNKNVEPPWKLG